MPNKNYQKGYRFQVRVKKRLEKEGWTCIMRAKSAFPDIHCWRHEKDGLFRIIEVECKWTGKISKAEILKSHIITKSKRHVFLAGREKNPGKRARIKITKVGEDE